MSKWWLLSATLGLWLVSGVALRPAQHTSRDAGRDRRKEPTRIVALAPNLTEILFALGLGDRLVGVTQDSDYPPAVLAKPKVGTFWQPGIEAVIATRPDLVVTLAFEQQNELSQRLTRMGYPCLTVGIERVGDLFRAVTAIGDAAGVPERARELAEQIRTRVRQLHATTAGLPPVKVLWVVQREPLRAAGRDTFVNEMIELAGGENALGPTLHQYPPVGAEQVIAAAPDVIIEPAMAEGPLDGQRRQALAYWRRYVNVPAAVNGRIYVIDGDAVSRLGPRLPAGIETIAQCLRPPALGE
jgi:iron complex transport system substrate-binding protein